MFNNTKPNIILLSDYSAVLNMSKTIGAYKVACSLRNAGYEVAVLHHLHVFTHEEIFDMLSQLISEQTLFVGINNFFYSELDNIGTSEGGGVQFTHNKPGEVGAFIPHGAWFNQKIKSLIKKNNPKCKIVLGGPNASDSTNNTDFDTIIVGYADTSIVNYADHLSKGATLEKSYHSIHGPLIINDKKAENYAFSSTPMVYHNNDAILPGETLVTEISRGCIFKCAYCSYPLNGKKKMDFIKHKEILKQEFIDNYYRFGTTRYIFSDDTVNDSVEKCKMIYDISQQLPFKLEWWGYIRLDLLAAYPETVSLLFDSGLKAAYFGIETLDQKAASTIGKGGDRTRLIETVRNVKKEYGNKICLHGGFIFGLPHESLESMKRTVEFLNSDANPLDGWNAFPLRMRLDVDSQISGFISDIDINYEKYGYTKIQNHTGRYQNTCLWKNEFTDFETVNKLVDDAYKANTKDTVTGIFALEIMGMGYDEHKIFNQQHKDVDWHEIDKLKIIRAQDYRDAICKNLNISRLPNIKENHLTFSEFLQQMYKDLQKVKTVSSNQSSALEPCK